MLQKIVLISFGLFFFLELNSNYDLYAFIRIDTDQRSSVSESYDVNLLVHDLERITGLQLYVQRGYIRIFNSSSPSPFTNLIPVSSSSGSPTARNLFVNAVESRNVYKIQVDRDANLGRVFKGDLIELDFLDQKYLRFRGVPRETFNASMIFFHELIHRHLALPDPTLQEIRANRNVKGPTVEYMNRIERELNLPQRAHYFPRINPVPGSTGFCIFFGDEGQRIEIDAEMFRSVFQSGKNQGYVGLLRK